MTHSILKASPQDLPDKAFFEEWDLAYRTLCAILYNFVPASGHPGGSISSGRIVAGLIFEGLAYDISNPDLPWADQLCYAAGHKALGLYAILALRNELVRIAQSQLLAPETKQLRLEDLLGFRKNPSQKTPLMTQLRTKFLDGHPTCATPFVKLATGASGVGTAASFGLAMAALDTYGSQNAPRIHVLEGEGGMTPGRVQEALAAAATMGLENVLLHVDWNQCSIDSNRVCAQAGQRGDYVQWDPPKLLRLHGWNVVDSGNGLDFARVLAAQSLAMKLQNGRPTAVIYHTKKGWKYGIEGKASHGAGHAFCSPGYYEALHPFEKRFKVSFPQFEAEFTPERLELNYFETLKTLRKALESRLELARWATGKINACSEKLKSKNRQPRPDTPRLERLYASEIQPNKVPLELTLTPGKKLSLRAACGDVLGYLNRHTGGAFLGCAADLLDSTSISKLNAEFPKGFYHSRNNPSARLLALGGICEDAMGAFMAGVSSYGRHIGVTSSYSAFIAPLEHIAARLHGIAQQTRREVSGEPFRTWIMVNAHAGPMTGEDGPTHADVQALQLLQNNFPKGVLITLTPWEPQEVGPLLIAGLLARPAVLCPFVTRPAETTPDRSALGLAPADVCVKGIYPIRRAANTKTTVVLQGSAVTTIFTQEVLPRLEEQGTNINIFYVTSFELFDRLSQDEQEAIFPSELAYHSLGITDFTLPTLYPWVRSKEGLQRSLHPFRKGRFFSSGVWRKVMIEAGLDSQAQLEAILEWCRVP